MNGAPPLPHELDAHGEIPLEYLRVPPHSLQAEQAVIGGLMLWNEAWETISGQLSASDFYRREHRALFEAIAELAAAGEPFDAVTIHERLSKTQRLDDAGGSAYIGTLSQSTPSAANIAAYADIVRERSVMRQLIQVGTEIANSGYVSGGQSVAEMIDAAERKVVSLLKGAASTSAARPAFKLVSAGDLVGNPSTVDWLIRDYLELGGLGLLFGDPASGKSLFALDWAACISMGLPWQGRHTRRGPVVYVAGEGFTGLRRRLKAIEQRYAVDLSAAPLLISETAANFSEAAGVAEVVAEVEEAAEKYGAPLLIIVDTLHRNLGAGDENSAADIAAFLSHVDQALRTRFGAAVLVVHHAGHGDKGRARGSSSLRAAVDAEYSVTKDPAGVVSLSCTKAKDFEPPADRHFVIEPVELPWADEDGQPISSVVLSETDQQPTPTRKPGRPSARNRLILDALNEVLDGPTRQLAPQEVADAGGVAAGQYVARLDDWREVAYLRVLHEQTEDARKKAFQRAKEALLSGGHVQTWGEFVWLSTITNHRRKTSPSGGGQKGTEGDMSRSGASAGEEGQKGTLPRRGSPLLSRPEHGPNVPDEKEAA